MTAHEAAHRLLEEAGKPQSSKTLADRMLKKGLVRSSASDPIASLAQTIEKNIRGKAYNRPELEFVYTREGRLIGIPARSTKAPTVISAATSAPPVVYPTIGEHDRAFVEASARLLNKVSLVTLAGLASDDAAATDLVIARGLDAMKDEIAAGLRDYVASTIEVRKNQV